MADQPHRQLADELKVAPDEVAFLADHDDADVARLLGIVRDAERRQAAALREAFDRSLEHVPRLVRRQVRKLLVGGEE